MPSRASEQGAAELSFQKLDRARQRRVGDLAELRGARKSAFGADGEEIFDLVHFHDGFHSLRCICSLDSVFCRASAWIEAPPRRIPQSSSPLRNMTAHVTRDRSSRKPFGGFSRPTLRDRARPTSWHRAPARPPRESRAGPLTVVRLTSRQNSGFTKGLATTAAFEIEYFGKNPKPKPLAIIASTQCRGHFDRPCRNRHPVHRTPDPPYR
jgi:hypothetical protein